MNEKWDWAKLQRLLGKGMNSSGAKFPVWRRLSWGGSLTRVEIAILLLT
jgi:hypothetical protein